MKAVTEASVGNDLSPDAETFAQAAQVPRHLPRRLHRSRKYRGIYRDVCAGRASTTAFAETFAQVAQVSRHLPRRLRKLRKFHSIYRDVCGIPANAKKFPERLAGLPQTPKSFSGHLRKFRKYPRLRQNVSPVATGIFFDPRGRRVIRKITTNYPIDPFINNK